MTKAGFLGTPELTPEAKGMLDEDFQEDGYMSNSSNLWAHQPALRAALFDMIIKTGAVHGLSFRQRGVLVAASASAFGDSYCSLAWGSRLAKASDPETAAAVLRGDDSALTGSERAMAAWARKVVREPFRTGEPDVQELRDAGFTDAEIFTITVYVALRVAYSTVNAALGARPDAAFHTTAPEAVLDAVTYGRPIED